MNKFLFSIILVLFPLSTWAYDACIDRDNDIGYNSYNSYTPKDEPLT